AHAQRPAARHAVPDRGERHARHRLVQALRARVRRHDRGSVRRAAAAVGAAATRVPDLAPSVRRGPPVSRARTAARARAHRPPPRTHLAHATRRDLRARRAAIGCGGPRNGPPQPPNARSAPGNPWRSSMAERREAHAAQDAHAGRHAAARAPSARRLRQRRRGHGSPAHARPPSRPGEVGRWWLPGTRDGDTEPAPPRHPTIDTGYRAHNTNVYPRRPDRAYVGYIDGGAVILDIADKAHPRLLGRWDYHPPFPGFCHTVVPFFERNLLVVSDESV